MTEPSTATADQVIADFMAGRSDRDPFDDVAVLGDEVRRLRAENARLVRQQAATQVANIASRRSLCEQRDRYLAERDALSAVIGAAKALGEEWRNYQPGAFYPEASAHANAIENCGDALIDLLAAPAGLAAPVDHAHDVPPHTHGGTDAPECTTCGAVAAPVGETPDKRRQAECANCSEPTFRAWTHRTPNACHSPTPCDPDEPLCEHGRPGAHWVAGNRPARCDGPALPVEPVGETPDEPECDMCASGEHYMAANDPLCLCCGAPRPGPDLPVEEQCGPCRCEGGCERSADPGERLCGSCQSDGCRVGEQ